MREIPLAALPSQSFSVTLDQNFYDFRIKQTAGTMSCTIVRNGQTIQDNTRIMPGYLIIPYQYQENGNFVLITENEELPDYTQFGISQNLIYLSAAELGDLRASN